MLGSKPPVSNDLYQDTRAVPPANQDFLGILQSLQETQRSFQQELHLLKSFLSQIQGRQSPFMLAPHPHPPPMIDQQKQQQNTPYP